MGAARTLMQAGVDVLLLEAAPRLGGNCRADDVLSGGQRTHRVDMGVSDFNRTTFHEFSRLVDELGLETRPICTDANFSTLEGESLCHVRGGVWEFGARVREPRELLAQMATFQRRSVEVLQDPSCAQLSVAGYLDRLGASPEFRELYVYSRAMGSFPMPNCHPRDYRIRDLIAFWKIHGVVGDEPANRHCIVGGMHHYLEAYRRWFLEQGGELRCGTRVLGIVREGHKVEIRTVDAEDRHERFEVSQVVLANNAHEALPLLEFPSQDERRVLASFPYQRARLVMHRDRRLVGGDESSWGAYNYLVPCERGPRVRPTISFFPNRLAGLPSGVPDVFVTMNPHLEPRAETLLAQRFFLHPVAGVANETAAAELQALQGRRHTWFAGSYLRNPFVHESALTSGMQTARQLLARLRAQRARRPRESVA